jgi:hypothetical protein
MSGGQGRGRATVSEHACMCTSGEAAGRARREGEDRYQARYGLAGSPTDFADVHGMFSRGPWRLSKAAFGNHVPCSFVPLEV